MDLEFPRIVYRSGGDWALESGAYTVRMVVSPEDLDAAEADGFHLDQYLAKAASEQAPAEPAPTRAELEQKAAELGVGFNSRTSDATLADRIAAALKG